MASSGDLDKITEAGPKSLSACVAGCKVSGKHIVQEQATARSLTCTDVPKKGAARRRCCALGQSQSVVEIRPAAQWDVSTSQRHSSLLSPDQLHLAASRGHRHRLRQSEDISARFELMRENGSVVLRRTPPVLPFTCGSEATRGTHPCSSLAFCSRKSLIVHHVPVCGNNSP